MVKILNETPINYNSNMDAEDPTAWVYKNPTKKEAEEVLNGFDELRGLTYNDDYYISDAFNFTHEDIVKIIKSYTKLKYTDYDIKFYISGDTIFIDDTKFNDNIKAVNIFKKFIPRLVDNNIINYNMTLDWMDISPKLNGLSIADIYDNDIEIYR